LRVFLVSVKSDGELIADALAGHEEAYASLMNKYRTRIHRFIRSRVADNNLAEELTQDTFVDAFRYLHTFRGDSQLYTWLCSIAIRRTFTTPPKSIKAESDMVTYTTPECLLSNKQSISNVANVMKKLPPQQAHALYLKAYENKSYDEIAKVLTCSKSYAKNLVYFAKRQIRKELNDE